VSWGPKIGAPFCNHRPGFQPHACLIHIVSSSPCGPRRYLIHGPCSNPTAQQLKVLLTAPPECVSVCVCVCCHEREPAALILAWDGSGASCYSWRAGKLSTASRVCVFVCLCVIGAASHLDQNPPASPKKPTAVQGCAFITHTLATKDKNTNHQQHRGIYFTIKYSELQTFEACRVKVTPPCSGAKKDINLSPAMWVSFTSRNQSKIMPVQHAYSFLIQLEHNDRIITVNESLDLNNSLLLLKVRSLHKNASC